MTCDLNFFTRSEQFYQLPGLNPEKLILAKDYPSERHPVLTLSNGSSSRVCVMYVTDDSYLTYIHRKKMYYHAVTVPPTSALFKFHLPYKQQNNIARQLLGQEL